MQEVRNRGKFDGKLLIVVDGYNAPVTAGNFVDLVDKKFYDGMEIQRADGFIVQTGDPGGEVACYLQHLTLPAIALSCSNLYTAAAVKIAVKRSSRACVVKKPEATTCTMKSHQLFTLLRDVWPSSLH